uniref:Genome polyprotein n=1 Tax=Rodent hepacvirus TaxID=2050015 RepID=A0A2H4MXI3_9FLAV|nr:polyprotein [Rodent hepacvirus]
MRQYPLRGRVVKVNSDELGREAWGHPARQPRHSWRRGKIRKVTPGGNVRFSMVVAALAIMAPKRRKPRKPLPPAVPKSREAGKPQKGRTVRVTLPSRRPPRRQGETWRAWFKRSAQGYSTPYLDKTLSWAAYFAAPTPSNWPTDPRKRARNLGRLVDGATGWVADVLGHVPVVGPLTGAVGRAGAGIIRGVEDVANMLTSPLGFTIFLLSILSCVGAVEHWCPQTGQPTNCCQRSEILACFGDWCWHEHGCVPCLDGQCWVPRGITWSQRPNVTLTDHWGVTDAIVAAIYGCDRLELGDYCVSAAVAFYALERSFPITINVTCELDCYLFGDVRDVNLLFFEAWYAQSDWLQAVMDALRGLPSVLSHSLRTGLSATTVVFIIYLVQGEWLKAALLVLFLSEAAAGGLCGDVNLQGRSMICYTPAPVLVPPNSGIPPTARACYYNETLAGGSYVVPGSDQPPIVGGTFNFNLFVDLLAKAAHLWAAEGFPNLTLTSWDGWCHRPQIGKCPCNYTDLEKGCTWERCGVSHQLTPHAYVWSTHPKINQSWPRWPAFVDGRRVWITVDCDSALQNNTKNRYRLPGAPALASVSLGWKPCGHHYNYGASFTGYLSFTPDGAYQVVSGAFALSTHFLFRSELMLLLLAALVNARWSLLLILLYTFVPTTALVVDSWAPVVAATASPFSIFFLPFSPHPLLLILAAVVMSEFSAAWVALAGTLLAIRSSSGILAWQGELVIAIGPFALVWFVVPLWRRARAIGYWVVSYVDRRVELMTLDLRLRRGEVAFACLAAVCWPEASFIFLSISVYIFAVYRTLVTLLLSVFSSRLNSHSVSRLLTEVYSVCGGWSLPLLRYIITLAGQQHIWLYDHLGDLDSRVADFLRSAGVWLDPVTFTPTQVAIIRDAARHYACGDTWRGLPVVARLGDLVMTGFRDPALLRGWRLSNPFLVTQTMTKGWLRTIGVAIGGTDGELVPASIAVLGSGLSEFRGFGHQGVLVTAYHASKGRTLATKEGPVSPLATNVSKDVAVYPLPQGMSCLSACNCAAAEGFMITRLGEVKRGVLKAGSLRLVSPLALNEVKGSSGSPILCKQGHVIGMLKSAVHTRKVVSAVKYTPMAELEVTSIVTPDATMDPASPPLVPNNYQVTFVHAPTGSGKTTSMPAKYVNLGYKVLVCNPSVATTSSIGPYMAKNFDLTPNIHTGTITTVTGSPLTYATYGKVLATDTTLLGGMDVVICDECHSVDATTVLGIGHILSEAEAAGVKLVILATATPPGCVVSPHPNIQEVELATDGDIKFYGKSLKLADYRKGRHLIFCSSKEACDTLAKQLTERGLNGVSYYRGKPVTAIPTAGDVVVVATDALCTGYSGNFDSVTDCNIMVNTEATIDLNPTFTIKVQASAADAVVRMQRRGRTGRGTFGVYRYCSKTEACNGIVSLATTIEAYDMGLVWFRKPPEEVTLLLKAYSSEVGLPTLPLDEIPLIEKFYTEIEKLADQVKMYTLRDKLDSYVALTAAQWAVSDRHQAPLPSNEGRWAGGRYKRGLCPLLVHLDCNPKTEITESVEVEALTRILAADIDAPCISGYVIAGGVLIGLGLLIESTSSLVVIGYIQIDALAMKIQDPTNYYRLGVGTEEECAWDYVTAQTTLLPYLEWLKTQAAAAKAGAAGLCEGAKQMAGRLHTHVPEAAPLFAFSERIISHMLSGFQMCLGLTTVRNNPPLAAACAFVAGVTSPLSLGAKGLLAITAGAVASAIAPPKSATAFAAMGVAGAIVGTLSLTQIVVSILGGYAAASTACSVTFAILSGQLPTFAEFASLTTAALNPGAAVAGVLCGVLLKVTVSTGGNDWTNRLLTMLTKGNVVCPNYFLQTTDVTDMLIKVLRGATPWELFKRILEWLEKPTETPCAGFRDLFAAAMRFFRSVVEYVRSWAPTFRMPLLTCDSPYKGKWLGRGTVTTKCGCGTVHHFLVHMGKAIRNGGGCRCYSWLLGGVPINSTTTMTARPSPEWRRAAFSPSFNTWYEIERKGGKLYLTGVSRNDLTIPTVVDTSSLAYADGVRVAQWCGTKPDLMTGTVTVNNRTVQLPFPLDTLGEGILKFQKEVAEKAEKTSAVLPPFGYQAPKDFRAPEEDPKAVEKPPPAPPLPSKPEPPKPVEIPHDAPWETKLKMALSKESLDAVVVKRVEVPRPSLTESGRREVEVWKSQGQKFLTPKENQDIIKKFLRADKAPEDVILIECAECGMQYDPDPKGYDQTRNARAHQVWHDAVVGKVPRRHEWKPCRKNYLLAGEECDCPKCEGVWVTPPDSEDELVELQEAPSTPAPPAAAKAPPTADETRMAIIARAKRSQRGQPEHTDGVIFTNFPIPVLTPIKEPVEAMPTFIPLDKKTCIKDKISSIEECPCDECQYKDMPPLEGDDGEWEDLPEPPSESEETACTWSYIWSGAPISTRGGNKIHLPVRVLSSGLGWRKNLVYWTAPASAEARKAKVTIWRSATFDKYYHTSRHLALKAANGVKVGELTFEEAASLVQPKSASSCLSGLTAREVRSCSSRSRRLVYEAYNSIGDSKSKYCHVTIMPKEEIFVKTPEKPGLKPARLIAYPPLEMRVAEKMVLGELAPAVAKAVLGEAYGFRYTPFQRVDLLVKWWKSFKSPFGFSVDTVCFDSTVTPDDVRFETELYCAGAATQEQADRVRALGNTLYTTSPMRSTDGRDLGTRQCRASGVLTTSTSNSITAFVKVRAACLRAGLQNFRLLVHGDDVIIMAESTGLQADRAAADAVSHALTDYGCPQASLPDLCYSLENITSCSSNVSVATDLATNRPHYYLTRDPMTPLGRAMAECSGRDVSATWLGNIILHYPALWASRVLMVAWLETLLDSDEVGPMVMEIWGCEYQIPIRLLPYIIEALHTESGRRLAYFTPLEVRRTAHALKHLGYPNLRAWKRKAASIRVRLKRRGGDLAFLADHLLWFTTNKLPPPLPYHNYSFKLPSYYSEGSFEAGGSWRPHFNMGVGIAAFVLSMLLITNLSS